MKVKISRLCFVSLAVVFRLLLDLSYWLFVSPFYSYLGFNFDAESCALVAFSYLLVFLTACLVPIKQTAPSRFIAGFLYLVSYVPTTSLMALGGYPLSPVAWLTLIFILLFFLLRSGEMRPSFRPAGRISVNLSLLPVTIYVPMLVLIVFLYAVALTLIFLKFGLKLPSLSFDVYGARKVFSESLEAGGRLFGYLVVWMGNVMNPFVMALAIVRRNAPVFFVAVLSQFLMFAIGGHKSILLSLPFVLWILAGLRYFRKALINYTVISFCLLIVIAMAVDSAGFSKVPLMSAHLTQRLFFTPALLYNYYLNFFQENLHTYLSQSILFSWLVDYPYELPIPNKIGEAYFSDANASANANMWADSYASFGVAGMFVYAVFFFFLLRLIDKISKDKNEYLVYALLAMPVFSITNAGLQTSLLTHGLLLAILLIVLLPRLNGVRAKRMSHDAGMPLRGLGS